ncbi:MAG TPA: dioxygenase, partial [Pusillimonas sp.]|nr:dioxygenase [Pusillimonas sp.]
MIRSLLHVGMFVPDLEVGRAFYELFGLQARASGNDLVFRCQGRDQDQIRLMQGSPKRLAYTSLGTNEAGMAVLTGKLQQAGVRIQAAPFQVPFGGIWFQDPHGDWLNVQVAEPAPPNYDTLPPEINAHGRYRRVGRACWVETRNKKAKPLR